ncbi:hypothetical protein Cs7R123_08550 [Catellatospora sp. TT07R-123]|uniref:hypothetical protein n=1 Tax=Catellatospora sp. TT07R-123 TaxID=2733863 RepID=UPI001B1D3E89|nr:hypothetical protein [Catellatospora sp. TT07R-123]GHJ43513.1 hypothetical protein Cs7R123_08550 [Catellatospora sp. TT07R-123]
MPQLVTVRVARPHGRPIRVWVPVLLVALLLSPVLILAVPAGIVACLVYRVSVTRAFAAAWRLLCALRGTRFDIEQGRTAVLVSIR